MLIDSGLEAEVLGSVEFSVTAFDKIHPLIGPAYTWLHTGRALRIGPGYRKVPLGKGKPGPIGSAVKIAATACSLIIRNPFLSIICRRYLQEAVIHCSLHPYKVGCACEVLDDGLHFYQNDIVDDEGGWEYQAERLVARQLAFLAYDHQSLAAKDNYRWLTNHLHDNPNSSYRERFARDDFAMLFVAAALSDIAALEFLRKQYVSLPRRDMFEERYEVIRTLQANLRVAFEKEP